METVEPTLNTVIGMVYHFLKVVNEHEKVRDSLIVIGAFYSFRLAVKFVTSWIFWAFFLGWYLTTHNSLTHFSREVFNYAPFLRNFF